MLSQEDNELLTRVGPGTPAGELFRRFWHPVTTSARLGGPDGPQLRVKILGEALIVFRDTEGQVGVLQAFCPHRRANLFWGRNEEGGLRCAYHGWKFDVTGQCVDMPTEPPASNYKEKLKAIGYPAVERGGFVWAYFGPREQLPPLPEYPWMDLPDNQRLNFSSVIECNYLQSLEGDVDTAHVSYLHRWLEPEGAPQPPVMVPGYRYFVGQDGAPKLTVKQTDYGLLYGGRRTLDDGRYYWRCTQWFAPAATHLPTTGLGQMKLNVPIDDGYTFSMGVIWNPDGPLGEGGAEGTRRAAAGENQQAFDRTASNALPGTMKLRTGEMIDHPRNKINMDGDYGLDRARQAHKFTGIQGGTGAEDAAIMETMGAVMDRGEEHLGVSDIAVVAARRSLLRLVKSLRDGTEPTLPHAPHRFHPRGLDIVSEHAEFEALLQEHKELLQPDGVPTA
ncbi:Rieske 2Fe-2S domain-containing protein [Phytohabitans flavus]|uniref:Ring-hydroxylating oxygenase subunit alpha n=1 Tax=Phytohabitans flavus TaxID=1076124 RepID=A0A6F8XVN0_9ACTN|nr:Rieske 2Fe-2S domain-containing protein [Phytohabitans flavus]BCB77886.1 ring-hydroxylating oxygenase subunit alpha [Phytohabitans flavus]